MADQFRLHVNQDYIYSKLHKGNLDALRNFFGEKNSPSSLIVSLNQLGACFCFPDWADICSKYNIYSKYGYVIFIPKGNNEHGVNVKGMEVLSSESINKILDDYKNGYEKEGFWAGIKPKNWNREELKEFFLEVIVLKNYYNLTSLLDEIIPKENYGHYTITLTARNYFNSLFQPLLWDKVNNKICSFLKRYGDCEFLPSYEHHLRTMSWRGKSETLLISSGLVYSMYSAMKYGINFLTN